MAKNHDTSHYVIVMLHNYWYTSIQTDQKLECKYMQLKCDNQLLLIFKNITCSFI